MTRSGPAESVTPATAGSNGAVKDVQEATLAPKLCPMTTTRGFPGRVSRTGISTWLTSMLTGTIPTSSASFEIAG